MKKPNHEARAADIWDALTGAAQKQTWMTYGELGRQIAVHHRALRYALEPVQAYCMQAGLPPLTILVRSAEGRLGAGFIAWDHDRVEEGEKEVFAEPWQVRENPFAPWRAGETMEALLREIIKAPQEAPKVFARIRVRGIQQRVFRQLMLQLYEGACALSGSDVEEGLEACHLVPWAEASVEEAFDPQNGILMNAWYHRLFDAGVIEIDDDYVVRITEHRLRSAAPVDREALQFIANRRLRLPSRTAFWPSVAFLRRRRLGE